MISEPTKTTGTAPRPLRGRRRRPGERLAAHDEPRAEAMTCSPAWANRGDILHMLERAWSLPSR